LNDAMNAILPGMNIDWCGSKFIIAKRCRANGERAVAEEEVAAAEAAGDATRLDAANAALAACEAAYDAAQAGIDEMNLANPTTMGMLPLNGPNAQPDLCKQQAQNHADSYNGEGVPDSVKDFYKRDEEHKMPPSVSEMADLNQVLTDSANSDLSHMTEEQKDSMVLTPEELTAVEEAEEASRLGSAGERTQLAALVEEKKKEFADMTPEQRANGINDGTFTIADQKALGDAAQAEPVDCVNPEPISDALCAKLKAMRVRSIKKRAAAWKYVEENFHKVMSGEEIHISLDGVDYLKTDAERDAEKEAAASGIAAGDPNGNYLTPEGEKSDEWANYNWEGTPEANEGN